MSNCERHTEHALRGGEGLVGRSFPDNIRWPEGKWDECDTSMGEFVYCKSHVRSHHTGWCSVSRSNKVPLTATTYDEAIDQARAMGFKIYGDD